MRDALFVTLLAYEGLRPEEVLALKVDNVGEVLRVRRKNVDGELLTYTKTRRKQCPVHGDGGTRGDRRVPTGDRHPARPAVPT